MSPTVLRSTATAVCSVRPALSLWPQTTWQATVQQRGAPRHRCSANTKHTVIFNTGYSFYLMLKWLLILCISCSQTHCSETLCMFQPLSWGQFYFKADLNIVFLTLTVPVHTERATLWVLEVQVQIVHKRKSLIQLHLTELKINHYSVVMQDETSMMQWYLSQE